jgi:ACT domain-containing protein
VCSSDLEKRWGSFSARLDEVERKADNIAQIQQDIAVIKQEIVWMKAFLLNMDR